MKQQDEQNRTAVPGIFGSGEIASILARFDWSTSPVGLPEQWPAAFRITLSNLLSSAVPMVLLWGSESLVFYNNAYAPYLIAEGRHPASFGRPGPEAYGDPWNYVAELVPRVLRDGETIFYEDLPTRLVRNGRDEEVYWTSSLSPVRGAGGSIEGVLVVCQETTGKVKRFNSMLEQSNTLMTVLSGPSLIIEEANSAILSAWGVDRGAIGKPLLEAVPAIAQQSFTRTVSEVLASGAACSGNEAPGLVETSDGAVRYYNVDYSPYRDTAGAVTGVLVLANDITAQVHARRRQTIAEDEMRSAITAADLGYWNVDPRVNSLSCNQRTRELFGLPLTEEDVDLSLAIASMHDDDRDRVVSTITRTVTDPAHSNYDIEYRVVHPDDGVTRHVRAIGKSYFDETGTCYRFSGTIQDITRKKLAEEALRRSEQRFEAAINAVQGVLWTNSADGRMLGEQPGWKALTGQTQQEYEGFGWASAVHPDDAQASVDAWTEAVREKRKFIFEHRLRRHDGTWGTYSIQAIPILEADGAIREWVGVHTDITEQRRAEEQLRQLADFMPQIVWSTDAGGFHDFYNRRWYEFTGLDYEESKNYGWSTVLHPDDAQRTWEVWQHSLNTGDYYEMEYRMRRYDGEYRWLLARATPVRNEDGIVLRWFGTCTDIHDQKTFAETLERLVDERTTELRRSNDDLQQFAHVASHDLKEPVRKIATFESRLTHEFGEELPERARIYLEKIRTAARRMYTMIEGVLRYSSLNEGEQLSDSVNLNEVVAQIRSDLEVLIADKGARVEAGPLPTLRGSATLLYQLFYNIINNALKFSAPERAPEVSITATEEGGAAVIRVRDNGIGFDPGNAERIFKTFTRLHPKDRFEGTGLGLALCQKIADRHGGSIRAEGSEGAGATFIVTLPLA